MKIRITVSDKRSSKSTTDFIIIDDIHELPALVEEKVEEIGYRKYDVELEAVDFEPTDEEADIMQQAMDG